MFDLPNARGIAATSDALLVEADDLDDAVWIPQSAILDESEVYEVGNEGTLVVKDWVAQKKGWL